jgi:hypothetical protein
VLPPGERPMSLFIGGLESRFAVIDAPSWRGLLSARLNGARRSFSIDHARSGSSTYTSSAVGLGASVGTELYVGDRVTIDAVLGHDWLFFRSYERLDRPNEPTSATWKTFSLRLGFSFVAARGSGL